jgi:hypothetical protein
VQEKEEGNKEIRKQHVKRGAMNKRKEERKKNFFVVFI